MEIKTVGLIGAGTMGNGIAHVLARSGYHVVLVEAQQAALEAATADQVQPAASTETGEAKVIHVADQLAQAG